MSIIIKGVDMPKDREILTLEINSKGEVTVYSTELKELECTPIAIEIPTPHGRLIDLGALPETRVEWEDIVNAPTILESEE